MSAIRPLVYWLRDVPRDSTSFEHGMSFVDVLQLTRSVASTPQCQYPKPIGVMVGRNVYPLLSRLHNFKLERDPSDIYFDPQAVKLVDRKVADDFRLRVGELTIHLPWQVFVDLQCGPDEFNVVFERKCGSFEGFTETFTVPGVVVRYEEACALTGTDRPCSFGALPA